MSIQRMPVSQIRLLINPQWIKELDAIAASRHITRLALIRGYLREKIDQELLELTEHFRQRDQLQKTQRRLEKHLEDQEWK
jgi:hypothetical protein